MGKNVLIDSSIFIQLLRRRQDPAIALLRQFESVDLVTCGIVMMEVLRGIRDRNVKNAMERFMSVMSFVASDNRLWNEAAELAWNLDRMGRVLPGPDIVIAASAVRAEAQVLTLDHHFAVIPGLVLATVPDDWR